MPLRLAEWALIAALLACLVLLVAGCASAPAAAPVAVATPVTVRVPVAVPCVAAAELPARPALAPDRELRALPDYELILTIEQQRRLLREYEIQAAALLAACVKPEGGQQ